MTLLNTLLALTNFRSPFLRTLVPSIGLAYAIQAGVAAPSIFFQSERFYDLSGSLTYLSCTALSLYLPTLRARAAAATVSAGTAALPAYPSLLASLASKGGVQAWNWRQVILSAAVAIWATRRTYHICLKQGLRLTDSQSVPSSSRASPLKMVATPASTRSEPHLPSSLEPSLLRQPGSPSAFSLFSLSTRSLQQPSLPCPSSPLPMSLVYSSTSAVSDLKQQPTSKRANGWKKRRTRSTMKIS